MKKLFALLLLIALCACSFRSDYFVLSYGDDSFVVGYDRLKTLPEDYAVEYTDDVEPGDTIDDIGLYRSGRFLANISLCNTKRSIQKIGETTVTMLEFFPAGKIEDYLLDGKKLDKSVKASCESLKGEYTNEHFSACRLTKQAGERTIVCELAGDILASDQDELFRILIYVE